MNNTRQRVRNVRDRYEASSDGDCSPNPILPERDPALLTAVKLALGIGDFQGQPRLAGILQGAVAMAEGRRPANCPKCGEDLTTGRTWAYCDRCSWNLGSQADDMGREPMADVLDY